MSAGGDLLIGRVIAAGAGFISPPAGVCAGRVLAIVLRDVVSQRLEVRFVALGTRSPLRTRRRAAGVFVVVAADLHDGPVVGICSVLEIQILVFRAVRQDEVSGGVAFSEFEGVVRPAAIFRNADGDRPRLVGSDQCGVTQADRKSAGERAAHLDTAALSQKNVAAFARDGGAAGEIHLRLSLANADGTAVSRVLDRAALYRDTPTDSF